MDCSFDKLLPDPDYLPGTTVYYKCGLKISFVRSVDSITVKPRLDEDISHLCKQISKNASTTFDWFDLVHDAVLRYFEFYGKPDNVIIPTNAPKNQDIEKNIIDRFKSCGYNLNKKMKKECGECDEDLHLMVFSKGVDQASTA
jgi:hypothetical protein